MIDGSNLIALDNKGSTNAHSPWSQYAVYLRSAQGTVKSQ